MQINLNLCYPLKNNLNKITPVLLWTNSDFGNSSLEETEVQLDLSQYNFFEVMYKIGTQYPYYRTMSFFKNDYAVGGYEGHLGYTGNSYSPTSFRMSVTRSWYCTDSIFHIYGGMRSYGGTATDSTVVIPVYLIGYKIND